VVRRVLYCVVLTLISAIVMTSTATARPAGEIAPVLSSQGTESCVSARLLASGDSGTRVQLACDPACFYLGGRLVCQCRKQLTVSCQVRCTVKCPGNRTYSTVGFAQTVGSYPLKNVLRRCLKTAERNARALAFVSRPKCKVTTCQPTTGLPKLEVARRIYFSLPGRTRSA